mgnify:CR=1 FL=1
MGIIMLIGLVGIVFFTYGFLVLEPIQRKAVKNAYVLLQEKDHDPKAIKRAMRGFAYSTNETKELIHRLMAKISP